MDQITQQINRARRRLWIQQLINMTGMWMFGLLTLAAIAILIPKVWAVDLDQSQWTSAWLLGSIVVALVGGLVTTWLTAPPKLEAAIEIDRRFGLKERISSTLSLPPEEANTEAGKALLEDAISKAQRIEVSEEFRLRGSWFNLLPLIPAILVFILAVFVPNATKEDAKAAASPLATRQVENSTDELKKKLAERKKKAEMEGLKEAEAVFDELEKGVDDLRKSEGVDQKKALVKLNSLAEQLEKRRQGLGDSEKLKEKLNQLRNVKTGPGDKMAKAMKKGDFKSAMKEIKSLEKKLKAGELTEQQQKALAEQLKQLGNMMQQMVDAQREAKASLKQEIEKQRQAGNLAKAAELQKKLDKLAKQDSQMQKLSKLAEKMAQAGKQMSSKDMQKAAEAMAQMSEEMSEMQSMMEQMELLDEAMEQLASAKSSMMCENCNGKGCSECQNSMQSQSMMAMMSQGRGRGMGMGMGQGRGIGDRPETKTNKNMYDSRVRSNAGRGKAVVTGLVDGPNVSGEAMEEIKSALQSAEQSNDDPLSGHKLPKDVRDHVRDYFERRGGNDGE